MAHHKRGRARNRRAGCKLCKPWKANGHRTERADGERFADHRRRVAADGALRQQRMAAPAEAGAASHRQAS